LGGDLGVRLVAMAADVTVADAVGLIVTAVVGDRIAVGVGG